MLILPSNQLFLAIKLTLMCEVSGQSFVKHSLARRRSREYAYYHSYGDENIKSN